MHARYLLRNVRILPSLYSRNVQFVFCSDIMYSKNQLHHVRPLLRRIQNSTNGPFEF